MTYPALKVAIVGGGVSGLSLAYYLRRHGAEPSRQLDITIFERKASLGGNAETVVVDLGIRRTEQGPDSHYLRWADLGVNDVNLTTYKKLEAIMREIGYLDHMKPLQDTESYFTRDGRLALTDDTYLQQGVSDPTFSLDAADDGLLAPLIQVVHRTALNLLDSITPSYTVGAYFDDCVARPREMLEAAARELGISINWADASLPARVESVRTLIYYPRIAAMYFADDRGPAEMPLEAPFQYYRVQEGGGEPRRRYFEYGAQRWLEALAAYLVEPDDTKPPVTIRRHADIRVRIEPGKAVLSDEYGWSESFDLVIVATHADDARRIVTLSDELMSIRERLDAILGAVRYTRSYAVCHTASGRLPPNKNVWRTYNIEIRDPGDTFFPYRIDYVANLHQNDPANPVYDSAGLPQYFVSLVNDLNCIPRQEMLDKVLDPTRLPKEMLDRLPESTRVQMHEGLHESGYKSELPDIDEDLHRKAWTYFKHNVLDARCIQAQRDIDRYNAEVAHAYRQGQASWPLLFAGGWTRGAGLQEQCMEQAERLSNWILGREEPPLK
ncbi:cyclopropane-fatty-acyl-phospholipid synthase [Litchfieldella qijiaojingensis]|uniref:Cyclopropane-fatty-acyl-phospholipid synthase n=1 Tax=Litchfieldella qijiaojingensis TaxID=980347 RepID=A0ABQ2YST9_9GAMM|nr:FAD-dependent oxidoreductase [Halomonas qijiaojingensis]GGX93441.1 cyclopropane-fatty-acyl-phospholipid synthase [Halomonas qijiaojingensis]